MTNNTSAHANCTHPATKSARAACRRERAKIESITNSAKIMRESAERAQQIKRARESAQNATPAQLSEYARLIAKIEGK